jgi:hypothetical protein
LRGGRLLGKNQRYTVEELSATEIESAFAAIDGSEEQQDAIENMNAHRMGLLEERYYRECPAARLKVITPFIRCFQTNFVDGFRNTAPILIKKRQTLMLRSRLKISQQ